MSKALLKEGTKSNVIIIPGIINEEPRQREATGEDFVTIASFEGDIERAVAFYMAEITRLSAGNGQLSLQLRRALEEKK